MEINKSWVALTEQKNGKGAIYKAVVPNGTSASQCFK